MRLAHADLCFPKLPCLAFPKRGVASWKWNDWSPGEVKLRSGVPLWPVRLSLLPDVWVFSLLKSALSRAMSLEDVFASRSLLCRPRLLLLRVLHRTTLYVVTVEDVAYWPVSGLICLSAVVIVKHKMVWCISGKNDRCTIVRWLAVHILMLEINGKWSSYGSVASRVCRLKGMEKHVILSGYYTCNWDQMYTGNFHHKWVWRLQMSLAVHTIYVCLLCNLTDTSFLAALTANCSW